MPIKIRRERYRWVVAFITLGLAIGAFAVRDLLQDRAQSAAPPARAAAPEPAAPEPPTVFPGAPRVVAIGDLHGDAVATLATLRLAGAIDGRGVWSGGDLVVVQTGDVVDRGDADREILDLFARLEIEAAEAGGAFRMLIGNHELMNVAGDYEFVSARGLRAYEDLGPRLLGRPELGAFPIEQRARAAAFRPGGPAAAALARRNVVSVVGDTVFVHAGILPEHVAYGLPRLNAETRAYVRGERAALPRIMEGRSSPVWTRLYSRDPEPAPEICATLAEALAAVGAKRMVVGHTVQEGGITSACGGRVWRIDTGMSSAYVGGEAAALEIRGDAVAPITAATAPPPAPPVASPVATPVAN